jgi:hypothetical protein
VAAIKQLLAANKKKWPLIVFSVGLFAATF